MLLSTKIGTGFNVGSILHVKAWRKERFRIEFLKKEDEMRRDCFWALAVAVCVSTLASPATAAIHNLTAFLDGAQETPPVATTGTGSATMTLDDVTNMFTLTGTFSDLIGTTTNAHVHGPSPLGGPGVGVQFGITYTPGVTSGSISFNGVITPAQTQMILDGLTYINIHTSFRSGGEIRGQILPEPATACSLLGGLLALTGVRRRRVAVA